MEKVTSNAVRNHISLHREKFKLMPGSRSIVSITALNSIFGLTLINPPKRILEIGTGLGTITTFLTSFTEAKVVSLELNSELLHEFKNRFQSNNNQVEVYMDEKEALQYEVNDFDWIIIDGPINLIEIEKILRNGKMKVVVIENQRLRNRLQIANLLRKSKIRFFYGEMDSELETGLCFFYLNKRGRANRFFNFLDYMVTVQIVLPRLVRMVLLSRGNVLSIGKKKEYE